MKDALIAVVSAVVVVGPVPLHIATLSFWRL